MWIKDEDFIRGKVPMTKFDVRILSSIALGLRPGSDFLDIGAGTGSISIQAACLGANVSAVEVNEEALALIKANKEKFSVDLDIYQGFAPEVCPKKSFDAIFIGGNRGKMEEIFSYIHQYLRPQGILVGNFVTLDNLAKVKSLLKKYSFQTEIKLLQVAEEDHLGILRGQNPIFMVRGVKI